MAQGLSGPIIDSAINYVSLAAGGSITLQNIDWHVVIITTSAPLATGTVTMCAAPFDGQVVFVKTDGAITALTVSPNTGQSTKNPPTTLAAGKGFEATYRASNTTWYFA